MPSLQSGLYLISPKILLPDSVTDRAAPDALYCTAPEEMGGPVTLIEQLPGRERQIWKVRLVDEANEIYTIERGDLTWLPPEYPPTFGLDGSSIEEASLSCLEGKRQNHHKWKISPVDVSADSGEYVIVPVLGESFEGNYILDAGLNQRDFPPFITGERLDSSRPLKGISIRGYGGGPTDKSWKFEPVLKSVGANKEGRRF